MLSGRIGEPTHRDQTAIHGHNHHAASAAMGHGDGAKPLGELSLYLGSQGALGQADLDLSAGLSLLRIA